MKESFRENVLEGITGTFLIIAFIISPLATGAYSFGQPFEGLLQVSVIFVSYIGMVALIIYGIINKKINLAALIPLIYSLIALFTVGIIFSSGINGIFMILQIMVGLIFGIILLVQAFDYLPVEESFEIKF